MINTSAPEHSSGNGTSNPEERNVFQISESVLTNVRSIARQMLETNETLVGYPKGGKRPMFHIALNKMDLSTSLATIQIDSQEVFIGFL